MANYFLSNKGAKSSEVEFCFGTKTGNVGDPTASDREKFEGMLEKAQSNIQTGLGQLDNVMGVRTRAIQKALKDVVSLPQREGNGVIGIGDIEEDEKVDF